MDLLACLLPFSRWIRLDSLGLDSAGTQMVVNIATTAATARCPVCGASTRRVHSGYTRTVADLPWAARRVCLQVSVRKFFCVNARCYRRIFTERVPALVLPWGRQTLRLLEQQRQLGLALGGSAGARLSQILGPPASRNTLLRRIRRTPTSSGSVPRVVGVDDFALRKGHSYGTILVDMERRAPLALLPSREAAPLKDWLQAHPGVEIIARDRAGAYADGAATGAPQARQVADRFHLLRNLAEVLVQLFEPQPAALKSVTRRDAGLPPPLQDPALPVPQTDEAPAPIPPEVPAQSAIEPVTAPVSSARLLSSPPSRACPQRRAHRQARYEQVMVLHQQGWTASAIAPQVGLNRKTVRQYVQAGEFCAERRRPGSLLDPYKPYLLARWNAGCRTGIHLFQDIRQQGYRGGRALALGYITRLRQAQGLPPRSRAFTGTPCPLTDTDAAPPLSPRKAAWRVLQRPDHQDDEDRQLLARLCHAHPDFDTGIRLAQEFAQLVRARQPERLEEWLARAAASTLGAFRRFAASLRRDYEAVKAGVTVVWSTGQVEGQINRLKMLKRQMFGRAGLDLLAQRVIQAH
jgi:transposase